MTPQEILNKCADEFFQRPMSWMTGSYIADHRRMQLLFPPRPDMSDSPLVERAKDPRAQCFCVVGKINQVAPDEESAKLAINHLARHVRRIMPGFSAGQEGEGLVINWNDMQSGPELVVEGLREAAKS